MEPVTKIYKNIKITVFEGNLEIKDVDTNLDLDIDNPDFETYYKLFYSSRTKSFNDLSLLTSTLADTKFKLYSISNELKKLQMDSLNSVIEIVDARYDAIAESLNKVDLKSHEIVSPGIIKTIIETFRNGYKPVIEEIEDRLSEVASELGATKINPNRDIIRLYFINKLSGYNISGLDFIELFPPSFRDNFDGSSRHSSMIDDVLIEGIFEDPIANESHHRDGPAKTRCINMYNYAVESGISDRINELHLIPSSGPAKTLIGNMLRACDRIVYRWFNDGDSGYRWRDGNFLETWNLADELNNLGREDSEFLSKYLEASYFTMQMLSNPVISLLDKISVDTVNEVLSDPGYSYLKEYYHNLDVKLESMIDLTKVLLNGDKRIPYCDMPTSELNKLTMECLNKAVAQLDGRQFTDGTVTTTIQVSDLSYSYIVNNQIYLEPFMDTELLKLLKFIKVTNKLIQNSKVEIPEISNTRFSNDIIVFEDGYSAAPEAIAIQMALYLALQDNPDFLNEPDYRDWRSRANHSEILSYADCYGRYDW